MSSKNNIIDFQSGVKKLKNISNTPSSKSKGAVSSKVEQKKIVPFPGSKLSSIEQALGVDERMKSVLGGRVIATLFGIFVLTVVTQSLWVSDSSDKKGRGLASTFERSLAGVESYLSESKRSVASVAKLPSQIEVFNFGTLKGSYTIKTQGSVITSFFSNGKSIKLGSVSRFLKKHKKLWKPKFASLRLSAVNKQEKTYTLLDSKRKVVGKAIVGLDKQGNLQFLRFIESF